MAAEVHAIEELAGAVTAAERVLVFTGAGMSTASGIPDFRGPQRIRKQRRPVLFQDFVASAEARREHRRYKAAMRRFRPPLPATQRVAAMGNSRPWAPATHRERRGARLARCQQGTSA